MYAGRNFVGSARGLARSFDNQQNNTVQDKINTYRPLSAPPVVNNTDGFCGGERNAAGMENSP